MEKKNLEKIYEAFIEEIEPTEEMKKMYNELGEKITEIKSNFEENQLEKIDELEDLFSKMNYLEAKAAFYKGFSVATNIILESKN